VTGVNLIQRKGTWIGAVIATALAASVHAQTAERPEWKVGDMWTFHQKGGLPVTESDWSRKVLAALANGRFTVETETGGLLTFDGECNSLDKRGPDYSWRRFNFPLQVGKSWDHQYKMEGQNSQGFVTSSWAVKTYETITVPAGTFNCFKVVGMAWRNWTPTNRPGGVTGANDRSMTTYWYCPAIRGVAKWQILVMSPFGPDITTVSELTSIALTP